MNHFLPDWMFAAFAIGGWELADLIARHFHVPEARYGGGLVVAVCACVLAIRYIQRLIARRRNSEAPDADEWKKY